MQKQRKYKEITNKTRMRKENNKKGGKKKMCEDNIGNCRMSSDKPRTLMKYNRLMTTTIKWPVAEWIYPKMTKTSRQGTERTHKARQTDRV